jgi:hypothetical protein
VAFSSLTGWSGSTRSTVTSIPGLRYPGRRPRWHLAEKRVETLLRLNGEACGLDVAPCRIDDPASSASLSLARLIADQIAATQEDRP